MIPMECKGANCASAFGNRTYKYNGKWVSDFHYGIDLVTQESNSNPVIIAFADGEVTKVVNSGSQYGTMCQVVLKHSNGYYTRYYHLKSGSIVVKVGDKVKANKTILKGGDIGQSIFIIQSGRVKCLDENNLSRELKEGDIFGEAAAILGKIRTSTVITITQTTCFQIPKSILIDNLGNNFADEIMKYICKEALNKSKNMQVIGGISFFNKIFDDFKFQIETF